MSFDGVEIVFTVYTGCAISAEARALILATTGGDYPTTGDVPIGECVELLTKLHALHPEAEFTAGGPEYTLKVSADGVVRVTQLGMYVQNDPSKMPTAHGGSG